MGILSRRRVGCGANLMKESVSFFPYQLYSMYLLRRVGVLLWHYVLIIRFWVLCLQSLLIVMPYRHQ